MLALRLDVSPKGELDVSVKTDNDCILENTVLEVEWRKQKSLLTTS